MPNERVTGHNPFHTKKQTNKETIIVEEHINNRLPTTVKIQSIPYLHGLSPFKNDKIQPGS